MQTRAPRLAVHLDTHSARELAVASSAHVGCIRTLALRVPEMSEALSVTSEFREWVFFV